MNKLQRTRVSRRAALVGCVKMVRESGLKGKARDDAALRFLGGATTVMGALGVGDAGALYDMAATEGYLGVLEALSDCAEDPEGEEFEEVNEVPGQPADTE